MLVANSSYGANHAAVADVGEAVAKKEKEDANNNRLTKSVGHSFGEDGYAKREWKQSNVIEWS